MNGRCEFWRRVLRARRQGSWSVRLSLAEAKLRRELAEVYAA